ncbi:MAG: CoA transferase [Dehalococcoidia bacterium]|nr:CoA transferase [Dehalococcoidia bacterium]
MRAALGIDDPLEGSSAKSVPGEAIAAIEAMFEERTTDEWMAVFDTHGVPASPVWFVEELLENPQVLANDYVVDLEHDLTGPQRMAAPPWQMSDSPPAAQGASPPLGRDTRKWLTGLGYSEAEIESMAKSGAIRLGFDG